MRPTGAGAGEACGVVGMCRYLDRGLERGCIYLMYKAMSLLVFWGHTRRSLREIKRKPGSDSRRSFSRQSTIMKTRRVHKVALQENLFRTVLYCRLYFTETT